MSPAAASNMKGLNHLAQIKRDPATGRVLFTKEMKAEYTILTPTMLPIHFKILQQILIHDGYRIELLTQGGFDIAQEGLRYVHNDTCYPALVVIGQLIRALKSGQYDPNKTAYMITQTGGGCRASNYIHLIRKALKSAGFEQVPVISLNLGGMERNEGFSLTPALIAKAAAVLFYGDILMCLRNQTAPYEIHAGDADALVERWGSQFAQELNASSALPSLFHIEKYALDLLEQFSKIPLHKTPKIKVGVVGEIYVKYSQIGNNNLEDFLAREGCEIMIPGVTGFLMYAFNNQLEDHRLYGGQWMKRNLLALAMWVLTNVETAFQKAFRQYPQFTAPATFEHTKAKADGLISRGTKMGEGWLLSAEILELADMGYENIVCTQPFGCLPNHICGKGMFRKIKSINPKANIVAIDYDASASRVNQENRIKLMLSMARENMETAMAEKRSAQESHPVSVKKELVHA